MKDLELIRETLSAAPPSARATVQARNRLTAAIEGRRSPNRARRWVAAGAGALASFAVLAILLASYGERPGPQADPSEASAQDILLAAATQAVSRTETGRYWRVRTISVAGPIRVGEAPNAYDIVDRSVDERWIARDPSGTSWIGSRDLGCRPRSEADERAWRAAGSPAHWDFKADSESGSVRYSTAPGKGRLERLDSTHSDSRVLGIRASELPADPDELRALIAGSIAAGPDGFAPGTSGSEILLFGAMSQLLVEVPATAAVRAAAFTVLAGISGIRSTGAVKDDEGRTGVGIELVRESPDYVETHQLVVDPTTYLIMARSSTGIPAGAGEKRPVKEQRRVILEAGWTDEKPERPQD
ncbi:CU044_5270 family protein [Actinoplanes sp. NPDC051861]|uniref:CU044_5270 family protein n=1 Tax=Actinoplanes sp. NPDC051861 TaxID=3155170 RepID=UPI00342EC1D4